MFNCKYYRVINLKQLTCALALMGGIIVTAKIVYMSQQSLGLEEQGALFRAIMASFLIWMVGGIYLSVAGDQWLSRGLKYQSKQK